tara:strand:- start:851 stop:1549 length:699 start_codon:yes stop_codon:yes gene_type:complete
MNKDKLEAIFSDDLGTAYFPLLAEEYLNSGDYDRALKVLEVGLLLNPNNNDGKYIKAKISMIQSDSKTAVKLLKEILVSDNLYINAMKMLALHYQSTGRNSASLIKVLHQILDLSPGDEFALELMKTTKTPKKIVSKKPKIITNKKVVKKRVTSKSKQNKTSVVVGKKPSIGANKDINPKMATLTFVDILIKQKQYSQASNLLKIINKNKSISKDSIDQRHKKIKLGLAKES